MIDEESRYKGLVQPDKFIVYAGDDPGYQIRFEPGSGSGSDNELGCERHENDEYAPVNELSSYFGVSQAELVEQLYLKSPG